MTTTTNAEVNVRIQAILYPWDDSRCRVCGWTFGDELGQCRPGDCSLRPKPARRADEPAEFSTNLEAAMAAYMAFRNKTKDLTLQVGDTVLDPPKLWYAELDFGEYDRQVIKYAETPAEAICLVILAAVEGK